MLIFAHANKQFWVGTEGSVLSSIDSIIGSTSVQISLLSACRQKETAWDTEINDTFLHKTFCLQKKEKQHNTVI